MSQGTRTRNNHLFAVWSHLPEGTRCAIDRECTRTTTIALAQLLNDLRWKVTPGCWQHGYAEAEQYEQVEEDSSILRFVRGHCGLPESDLITLIGPCPISEVPDYRPWEPLELYGTIDEYNRNHREDRAWKVQYTSSKQKQDVHVVWSFDVMCFDLYLPVEDGVVVGEGFQ